MVAPSVRLPVLLTLVARLIREKLKKKKKEKTQVISIGVRVVNHYRFFIDIKRIIKEYFEQFYAINVLS